MRSLPALVWRDALLRIDPMALKLQQGQVWKHGDEFIRIVHLERLEVGYKVVTNLKTGDGKHHHTSKKDFCRLLKGCRLLARKPAEVSDLPSAE